MASKIPKEHRAAVLESFDSGLQVRTVATPEAGPGSVVVQVLSATIISYQRDIYNGQRDYSIPMPLVGGSSAIGRVVVTGHDAVLLKTGQLVFVNCVIRGRDNPDARYLTALHEGFSEGSKKLMRDVWRDGAFAQYFKAPLENCIPLNETKLCKSLGYPIHDLMYIGYLMVPFGGLRDINLEPGETLIVSPATGGYGGAAVQVAVAMGARVIALGRNERELARLKDLAERGHPGADVEIVKISGDEATDTAALQAFGPADAIIDFTPPVASKSTHLKSAISQLRNGGRVSLMGFGDVSTSMWHIIGSDITMKGRLMYSREDMLLFVKMLERGLFPKGKDFVNTKKFSLDQCKEALDVAAEHTGMGKSVVFTP